MQQHSKPDLTQLLQSWSNGDEQALQELEADPDLINQVLEITCEEDSLRVRRYHLPAP